MGSRRCALTVVPLWPREVIVPSRTMKTLELTGSDHRAARGVAYAEPAPKGAGLGVAVLSIARAA